MTTEPPIQASLVAKLEAAKHDYPNHPRGIGYNEGLETAIAIIRQHEATCKESLQVQSREISLLMEDVKRDIAVSGGPYDISMLKPVSIEKRLIRIALDACYPHTSENDIRWHYMQLALEAYEAAKTEQPDDCREAFEKWAKEAGFDITRYEIGCYGDPTQQAWAAWNAATKHESVQPDEFTLLGILADIRQKTGVGDKPMLSDLPDVLAGLIKRESLGLTDADKEEAVELMARPVWNRSNDHDHGPGDWDSNRSRNGFEDSVEDYREDMRVALSALLERFDIRRRGSDVG